MVVLPMVIVSAIVILFGLARWTVRQIEKASLKHFTGALGPRPEPRRQAFERHGQEGPARHVAAHERVDLGRAIQRILRCVRRARREAAAAAIVILLGLARRIPRQIEKASSFLPAKVFRGVCTQPAVRHRAGPGGGPISKPLRAGTPRFLVHARVPDPSRCAHNS